VGRKQPKMEKNLLFLRSIMASVITCLLERIKIISVGQAQIYPQVIAFSLTLKASSDSICNCLLWREDYIYSAQHYCDFLDFLFLN